MIKSPHYLKWLIWSLAIVFFIYEYVLRVLPSSSPKLLMQALALNSTGFGMAMAFYFYAYTPLQVVSGVILDKYGPRLWLPISSLLCAAGCFILAQAEGIVFASLSRFLMGMGSATAFISIIYLSTHWFDPKDLALLLGLGNALGNLGAALGQGPLGYLIAFEGIREISHQLGIFGVLLAIIMYVLIRNDPPEGSHYHPPENPLSFWESLRKVCGNPKTWVNGMTSSFFYLVVPGFVGLWAPSFIHIAYGLNVYTAASAASLFFVGIIFGSLSLRMMDKVLGSEKRVIVITPLIVLFFISLLIYVPLQLTWWPFFCLFVAGFFVAGQLCHFTIAVQFNTIHAKATASAVTNALTFIGICIAQPLVGYLLDQMWSGEYQGGIRVYSLHDYQVALSIFPAALFLASLISLLCLKTPKHLSDEPDRYSH